MLATICYKIFPIQLQGAPVTDGQISGVLSCASGQTFSHKYCRHVFWFWDERHGHVDWDDFFEKKESRTLDTQNTGSAREEKYTGHDEI